LPLVKSGDTYFRAAFPRASIKTLNVVIALHGAGGSENSFFDACGRGGMAMEALKRGWAFIAPRSSTSAVKDVLDWLKIRRKQTLGRVFVIGYGEGASAALQSGVKLSAVALLAPTPASFSNFDDAPLYVGVGKEDSLAGAIRAEAGRKSCDFQEFEACERYTVVAEASPSVFRFFDAQSGR
jgi:predicted esterase